MFACRACVQRCLRAVVADSIALQPARRFRSGYSTASEVARLPARGGDGVPLGGYHQTSKIQDPVVSPREGFILRAELKYLSDPLALADRIRALLNAGHYIKAISLVRTASKDMKCTVGWNCVLDGLLREGKVKIALKLYNEMKKRSQVPDAHTYTHLLRALADNTRYPLALGKALAIYHSMYALNSRVKPTIIHTNAVLKVCARAGDMDSLWGIAAKLPDSGMGAPDTVTWTTILNALRHHASTSAGPGESVGEVERRQTQAILEGRRIWDDIVGRWRRGNLWIDERLVGAMGRLLLIGSRPMDWDDVLSLVRQTSAVPRLRPKLGVKAQPLSPVAQLSVSPEEQPASDEESGELIPGGEFESLVRPGHGGPAENKSDKPAPFAFASVGQETLSLVLEACIKLRAKQRAVEYWSLLTSKESYGVRPDQGNFNAYLRLLRVMRSSGEALRVVEFDMPDAGVEIGGREYFLAMSVCARDKLSSNSFDHATRILDLMVKNLRTIDLGVMALYIDIACWTNDRNKIMTAVTRAWQTNVVRGIPFDRDESRKEKAVVLMRKMVGCCDRLEDREMAGYGAWVAKRKILAAQVTRMTPGADKNKARKKGRREEGVEEGEKAEVEAME
ncbi:MAG: hypothetical protein M1840_008107 [Geoglossum simile]|nr:MAG: hypothetical protein M1840_008107 [Geoglossum simile]